MALVCLHYSKFFRENLVNKRIKGTILNGEWNVPTGKDMYVYVTEANSVEEGKTDHKIGKAKILKCYTKRVGELNDKEAIAEGFINRGELIKEVKYWHKLGDENIITFLEFELDIF